MSAFELFSLLGGVGLFLYGMTIMSTGLRNACGERLKAILEYAILSRLVELRTPDMHPGDLDQVHRMTLTVSDIERLSDHAENIIEYGQQVRSGRAVISPEAQKELRSMCELTLESVELCLDIFATGDYSRFAEAEALENQVDRAREQLTQNHIQRFLDTTCDPRGGVLFCDMITDLERCSDHAINIAASLRSEVLI